MRPILQATDARYLSAVPEVVPDGRIVVHNRVRPSAILGLRGFRAWTEPENAPNRVLCTCGWAPHLPAHYRVGEAE